MSEESPEPTTPELTKKKKSGNGIFIAVSFLLGMASGMVLGNIALGLPMAIAWFFALSGAGHIADAINKKK